MTDTDAPPSTTHRPSPPARPHTRGVTLRDAAASRALRQETEANQEDRNLAEILQELRVLQTGTQVLAGFLLTLPFQSRFTDLSGPQTLLFVLAMSLAVLTALLLVTPVAVHRALFQRQLKARIVQVSHTMVRVGLVTLGLSVVSMFALILALVVSTTVAVLGAGLVGTLAGLLWMAWPVLLRRPAPHMAAHHHDHPDDPGSTP